MPILRKPIADNVPESPRAASGASQGALRRVWVVAVVCSAELVVVAVVGGAGLGLLLGSPLILLTVSGIAIYLLFRLLRSIRSG